MKRARAAGLPQPSLPAIEGLQNAAMAAHGPALVIVDKRQRREADIIGNRHRLLLPGLAAIRGAQHGGGVPDGHRGVGVKDVNIVQVDVVLGKRILPDPVELRRGGQGQANPGIECYDERFHGSAPLLLFQ